MSTHESGAIQTSDGKPPLNVLFLLYGNASPADHQRFHFLSQYFSGDVIEPAGSSGPRNEAGTQGGPVAPTAALAGRFRVYAFASRRYPPVLRSLVEVAAYLRIARGLVRSGARYDAVVAFGLFKTAIAGWLISILCRIKFIIELPIVLRKISLYRYPTRSFSTRVKAAVLAALAARILRRADHIKLIFPSQLDECGHALPGIATSAFPDFVAVHDIGRSHEGDFLLLIGTPLYLKGADIAIKALQRLSSKWSGERLVIVGSSVGFPYLRALLASGDHVEFHDFVPHDVAIDYIRRSKLVLIPSRTDAMPRVAVEAMAAGKALVASRVDGIPHYLRHNVNCLLTEPENPEDLAAKIEILLREPARRQQIGEQARRDALPHFDENRYAEQFHDMLRKTLGLAQDDVQTSGVFRSG